MSKVQIFASRPQVSLASCSVRPESLVASCPEAQASVFHFVVKCEGHSARGSLGLFSMMGPDCR